MTNKIYEFKTENKMQILAEAEFVREQVRLFNEENTEYKIEKIVLGSSKVHGLFNGPDTLYLSITDLNDSSFKDLGYSSFSKNVATLEITSLMKEIIQSQTENLMKKISPLLESLKGSKILKFESAFELEIGCNFKKEYTKEIFDRKTYKDKGVPLRDSLPKEKDFFIGQKLNYQLEGIKDRISETPKVDKGKTKLK